MPSKFTHQVGFPQSLSNTVQLVRRRSSHREVLWRCDASDTTKSLDQYWREKLSTTNTYVSMVEMKGLG